MKQILKGILFFQILVTKVVALPQNISVPKLLFAGKGRAKEVNGNTLGGSALLEMKI